MRTRRAAPGLVCAGPPRTRPQCRPAARTLLPGGHAQGSRWGFRRVWRKRHSGQEAPRLAPPPVGAGGRPGLDAPSATPHDKERCLTRGTPKRRSGIKGAQRTVGLCPPRRGCSLLRAGPAHLVCPGILAPPLPAKGRDLSPGRAGPRRDGRSPRACVSSWGPPEVRLCGQPGCTQGLAAGPARLGDSKSPLQGAPRGGPGPGSAQGTEGESVPAKVGPQRTSDHPAQPAPGRPRPQTLDVRPQP